jgi:hypothetical protein
VERFYAREARLDHQEHRRHHETSPPKLNSAHGLSYSASVGRAAMPSTT